MLFPETKIILDLCGGSGAWSKDYKDAGYDVRIITLPDHNVIDFIPPKNVYGILAAPPCTEFSRARNGHPEIERDFIKGMNPVNACFRIFFQCDPVFWALENPMGLLSRWLGRPHFYFDPWEFGDPFTKRTAIWGKFNRPIAKYIKKAKVMTEKQIIECQRNNKPQDRGNSLAKAEKRAITPAGFARAFFEANQ